MTIDATKAGATHTLETAHARNGGGTAVLVVGGGPAGSATAFFLARAGVNVTLLDRARFPRDKPCSEYLSPQAARILDEMGALPELDASPHAELSGMRVRSPGGAIMRGDFAADHGYRGYRDRGFAIRRTILDTVLLERARLAGARVVEGVRVTALLRDARGRITGVGALDADGRAITFPARVVIGADGLRSVVAKRLGLTRARPWPRRLALVTHYRGIAGMSDVGEMHVEREGYAGLADVGDGVTNVAVVVPASEAKRAAADRAAYMTQWIQRRPHLVERFAGAERVGAVLATGPFASHVTQAWSPGAALVGDAADFFDPFTGEGIYAALRGGELLATRLLPGLDAGDGASVDDSLRAYEQARRAEFGGKWMVERMVGVAVGFPPLIDRVARVLSRRKDMADLLVGVTGDFVPARAVLRPRFLAGLILG